MTLRNSKSSTHEYYLNRTIFIIDDEQIMIDLISQIFQEAGYRKIHGFTKSTEALELLRFVTPDLILTDIHMPDLSGTFFAKLVNEFPQFETIPLLAVTGDNSDKTQEKAIRNGIFDIVLKPINKAMLLEKVLETLNWVEFQKEVAEDKMALANPVGKEESLKQLYRAFGRA